jgi:hypothetical protein
MRGGARRRSNAVAMATAAMAGGPARRAVDPSLPEGVVFPVGDASNGLCGGMAYTVRDYFEARYARPRPTATRATP